MKAIGEQVSMTRSAVAGMVYRMRKAGIPLKSRDNVPPPVIPEVIASPLEVKTSLPNVRVDLAKRARDISTPMLSPDNALWKPIPEGRTSKLLEAERNQCRWPVGQRHEHLICGAPIFKGAFCNHHHHIAYTIPVKKPASTSPSMMRTAWSKPTKW